MRLSSKKNQKTSISFTKRQKTKNHFYGTVLTIKRHKKLLWTVLWFQIFHKKFCITKFPIFWGYLPKKIKRPVSVSLNVKKQRVHFYGTVLTIKRHKKILWAVSWFQISHKKFCIIKFPIFWGYLPNKIKRPVSASINVKKQKIHFYSTVLTIKRHKKIYEPFYGFKFSIKNSVL